MQRYLITMLAAGCLTQTADAKPMSAPMQRAMAIGQFAGQMAAEANEFSCMSGTPMPPDEIAEARTPAIAAMQGYWRTVQSGGAILPFFVGSGKARWRGAGEALAPAAFADVRDPLAAADNRLVDAPIWFVRAGDAQSALGIWNVVNGTGQRVGAYRALLRREGSAWKLFDLEQTGAERWHNPAVQYCHAPDDVPRARLSRAQSALRIALNDEARAIRKAARIEVQLRQALEASQDHPESTSRQRAYDRMLGEAREAKLQVNGRRAMVIRARQDLAEARAQMRLAGLEPEEPAAAAEPAR